MKARLRSSFVRGNWNCVAKSQLDGATLRSIRGALAMHCMQEEQRSAEDSLRKLSRAVEQSPDTVAITDRKGVELNTSILPLKGLDWLFTRTKA